MQVAAAKQAQQEKGVLAGAEEEVKGFLMGRLLERKPELEQELLTFRDHLLAASSSDDDVKLKVSLCYLSQLPRHFSFSKSQTLLLAPAGCLFCRW